MVRGFYYGVLMLMVCTVLLGEKPVYAAVSSIVEEAEKHVGVPYQYGGESPSEGFDSSGFSQYVYQEAIQMDLPRTVSDQAASGTAVQKSELKAGDLLFFSKDETSGVTHVGLYAGDQTMIHASASKGIEKINYENSSYWSSRYTKAVRVNAEPDGASVSASHPVAVEALTHVGAPYVYGGEQPDGFDSSGFVQYVIQQVLDFDMPRTLSQQIGMGESVDREALQEGDILFFSKDGSTPSHAAVYAGRDQIVHPTLSSGVKVTAFEGSSYWSGNFMEARRITEAPKIAEDHDIVAEALKYLGVPYVFGGESPETGFDCSAFTRHVFEKARQIFLPRSTDQQWQVGEDVALTDIQPGDVVFFSDTYREGISHNGIYVGDGQFIHASRSEQVTISYLSESYWQDKFTGVKRFDGLQIPKEHPVVSAATQFIGEVPYQSGGTTPGGFDTAGFVQYAFKQGAGISLPRYAGDQWNEGTEVSKEDLQPGDIVFFQGSYLNPSIYIGNGQVVHVTLSEGVRVTNMHTNSYWAPKYYGAKRIN
ncbi:NlpC/P60 family protein [Halobacillus halophilus]|nr:NlpC/P60 family protein [Halobacillus halophilus]